MSKRTKNIAGIIFLVIFIAALIILSSSLVVTKENEYSIIKRFDKIDRVIDSAGLSLKTPFIRRFFHPVARNTNSRFFSTDRSISS